MKKWETTPNASAKMQISIKYKNTVRAGISTTFRASGSALTPPRREGALPSLVSLRERRPYTASPFASADRTLRVRSLQQTCTWPASGRNTLTAPPAGHPDSPPCANWGRWKDTQVVGLAEKNRCRLLAIRHPNRERRVAPE